MAQVKEITTSGGGGSGSSAPASNAGSVAKASANSSGKTSAKSAAGSYSKSGGSSQSSKSISKAALNTKAAIAAGARHASTKSAGVSSSARFGSGISSVAKPLAGTFSQQGTPQRAGVYAGGGLNPSAWGSSMLSPSVRREDSALQKAIDDISLPVDYEDRNIHAIDPGKDADESYLQKAAEFNIGRQIWAFNDTAGALNREYASNEEQLADILDLMTHAQVYYNDARKNDYKFNVNGEEVSAADEWKNLYDELERRSSWLTDVGQVQDLFTRYQNGEDITLENVDTMTARAQARLDNAYDDEDSAMWHGIIGDLNNIWGGVNRKTAQNIQSQIDELGAQLEAAKNASLVAEQSENSLNFADVIASEADRQLIKDRAAEARAATQGVYDQQMAAQAQLDQLNADYRARFMTPEVEAAMQRLSIAQLGKAYPKAHGKADAERMRQEDQQLVDDWNSGMGFAQQYYNWQDRIAGVSQSFAARTAGSAMNLAAWAADAVTHDNDQLREAQQARDMAARAYLTDATPENKAALDAAEAALNQAQNDLATGKTERTGVAVKLEDIADNLDEKSQAEIVKAKEGASKWGQFGLDLLSTAMDMGLDALTGGGLKTMFARVAGSGIGEARRAGASSEQQLAYGLAQGAVEALTEKLTDGVGFIYGKGVTTDVVEKAISRLANSDAGANFLRILNGAIGEGGEEVLSDLAQPFIDWIIDENARDNHTVDIDLSEMLYDFLLGGAMGLLGQGVEAANGSYAAKNIAQTDAMTERYDALMEELGENPRQVTGAEQTEIKRLEARMGDRENGSNPIGLFGSPLMQQIRRNTQNITTRSKGVNRHDTATGVLAEGFEDAGYVNSTNADEDYNTATTGAETRAPSSDAEALAQNEAPEEQPVTRTGEEELQYEDEQNQRDLENEELQRWGGQTDPKTGEPVMASETASGAQGASIQANTQENPQPSVKLEGNERGEAVTSEEAKADAKEVVGKLQNAVAQGKLNTKESVSNVKASEFQKVEGQSLVERVSNFFKGLGNKVKSAALGGQEVILDERGVKSDIAHGLGKAKAATFAAVPDVIANGKIIDTQKNWKGRGYDTQVIAGRVSIDGKGAYVACVVTSVEENGKNRFYLHEVVDASGNLIYSFDSMNKNAPAANIKTGVAENGITGVATGDTASIAQNPQADNSTNSSTNVSQAGTINPKVSNKLDPYPKDLSADEAHQYADAASPEWTIYIDTGDTAVVYDGEVLYNVDEDGFAYDPRKMPREMFAARLQEWTQSDKNYYTEFAERPVVLREGGTNGNIQGTENDTTDSQSGEAESNLFSDKEIERRRKIRELAPDYEGEDAEDLKDAWAFEVFSAEKEGASLVDPQNYPPVLKTAVKIAQKLGVKHVTVLDCNGNETSEVGFVINEHEKAGVFLKINYQGQNNLTLARTLYHESFHAIAGAAWKNKSKVSVLTKIANEAGVPGLIIDDTLEAYCLNYAEFYLGGIPETWDSMTDAQKASFLDTIDPDTYNRFVEKCAEEVCCDLFSENVDWLDFQTANKLTKKLDKILVGEQIFTKDAIDNRMHDQHQIDTEFIDYKQQLDGTTDNGTWATIDYETGEIIEDEDQPTSREQALQQENEALKQRIAELEAAQQEQAQEEPVSTEEQQEESQTGRTPGRVKQSQSAFEQDVATKGERANTDAAMGEAEFLSKTNEARSRTADALTDTQEKADAQAQRLLQEDYVWNDDDVVIAQKLMFDMVKAIRDYQLKKNSKMKPEAFKRMTEQYNQLMTKHQEKLSKAGQELQANYMFSTGDKIVMKAAQTFLGFTKDGRFAGASVNAKNAKIYAGIEEASKRIQKAVDAEDVQGLAKICKDISDIRNVKKMFGPLGGYASEMESRVLDKIAKGENAAQNLENLAYGNLNAVCDDVQPYKALNAAKTIRVMNMLSNTATIVNNLANNFAQGAVNRSRVNQAFNSLAAKPFAALTGQEVLSQTARGKEARQAVRNAKMEALETATLMQMYGITEENGRLELNDRGMFNPNINPFEQTMSLYKFLTGIGVEATDKMQAAGILKSMELGIDADIKAGKIEAHTKEQRMQEARHEVNRLLYKDDNSTTALVQHIRDFLNKWSIGNDRVGTIGVGDITMAFAKIPANVVRARLSMTPEGALLQVVQYARGVNKAKRMHAEVLARGIVEAYQEQINEQNENLQEAYAMEWSPARDAAIRQAKSELEKINRMMWAEAQDACRGSVYRNLRTIAGNYNENMMFNEAVERAGYMNAKEMSQFEAAQLSRKIGRAATSAGMMALGSVLRALGALRDFDQEPDDELRKMNSDKGYRGLMMNLSAIGRKNHEWKDGDLIIDGEFLEVIAMPLTIGATAAEAAATAQDAKTWSWLKSMAGNGIAKTFEAVGDIPGMADAINMYESLTSAYNTDYDEKTSRLLAGMLQYAANTVPSFFLPNSISQAAAGFDNKVRDVYTANSAWGQAANIFKNKFPGLRNTIPVSVDVWGNERTYGEGLWGAVNKMLLPGDVHVYRKNKYEAEIERMVKAGYGNATPKTTVNSSFEVGDEKYTMTAQEKLDFKAARNNQQRELFEAFIDSDYYQQLNDAERMKVFQSLKTSAERDAKQDMLNGRQLSMEISRDKWETELLDVNDQIQFLAAKQMANNVFDRDTEDMDYAAVDQYLTGAYKALDETQRNLLGSSFSRLDDMFEAKNSYGIGSQMFTTGYDIYKDYMSDEGRARVQGGYKDWEGSQMYTDIAKVTGASEKQMDFFEKKFVLYNNNAVVPEKYNSFVDAGWSREAAQSLMVGMSGLQPTNGRKTVSYKQRLTEIALIPGLTEAQRWEAFFEYCPSSYTSVIKSMSRYKSNGFSYEKALKAAKKWDA